MGTYNINDVTIAWFLKTEFLNRLPTHVQSILAAFESHSLEEIAKIATSIIHTEHNVRPSQTSSDNALSILIKELNAVKLELATLQQNNSPICTQSNFFLNNASPSFFQNNRPSPHTLLHSTYNYSSHSPAGPHRNLPRRTELYNGQCFYHHHYFTNAKYCAPGCRYYQTFKKPLNYQGGVST